MKTVLGAPAANARSARTLLLGALLLLATTAQSLPAGEAASADDRSFGGSLDAVLRPIDGVERGALALGDAADLVRSPPSMVVTLDERAPAALAGYLLVASTVEDQQLILDPAVAGAASSTVRERAALGAYALGWSIERGDDGRLLIDAPAAVLAELSLADPGPETWLAAVGLPDDGETRSALVAAMAEANGAPAGRVAIVAEHRVEMVTRLLADLEFEVVEEPAGSGTDPDDGVALVLPRRTDRVALASVPVGCVANLPLVGGRGCRSVVAEHTAASTAVAPWRVGITGPLDRAVTDPRRPEDGSIGWTNLEAQRYVASATTIDPASGGIEFRAEANSPPNVLDLPFTSGMVVSDQTLGWGHLRVHVRVPIGQGLWPAIWLLGTRDCDGPGRCDAYQTTDYHEIDLLETRGDTTVVLSAHTIVEDGRLRTETWDVPTPALASRTVRLDLHRRPGLITWSIDQVEVARLSGPAVAGTGIHQASRMRVVANLAVGGSFTGDRPLGRGSGWLGDARVPTGYPELGWDTAGMEISAVTFTPLGPDPVDLG